MKRTPLNPGTKPLRRKKPMPKPSKPMAKRNARRQKKRRDEGLVYGDYHAWVSGLPCLLAHHEGHRCWFPVKGHHLSTVGSGGRDEGNEVPACVRAHDELHWSEAKFEAKYGIDLESLAHRLEALWQEMQGRAA